MSRPRFTENKNLHTQNQHAVPIAIGTIQPYKNNFVRIKNWSTGITQAFVILLLLFWIGQPVFSQQFTDILNSKLPKPYQDKLVKADSLTKSGKSMLLSDENTIPDTSAIADTALNEFIEFEKHYQKSIKASQYFKNANKLTFSVLDKFIKDFWKKFNGDKTPLEIYIITENSSYDSLLRADQLRKSRKKVYHTEIIHLVSNAEKIEEKALFALKKVLYVYLNWPEPIDEKWVFSRRYFRSAGNKKSYALHFDSVQTNLNALKNDTNKINVPNNKETINKATSIYNLLHISESQIDDFNDFLNSHHPSKAEIYLTDFQQLDQNSVDSLKKQWQEYSLNKTYTLKPAKPNLKDKKGFLFKVQISACRVKMPTRQLRRIYPGKLRIIETYEDNWYKYTLKSFKLYQEARNFREKMKVKKAFVVAYYNGKRIKITTDMIQKKS